MSNLPLSGNGGNKSTGFIQDFVSSEPVALIAFATLVAFPSSSSFPLLGSLQKKQLYPLAVVPRCTCPTVVES